MLTYSGWPVVERSACRTYAVPGNASVKLPLLPTVAPVMLLIAQRVDQRVAEIETSRAYPLNDDWGHAKRAVRDAPSRWSNHAGGVAMDLNATQWPRGVRRMTAAQRSATQAIVREINEISLRVNKKLLIDWGGDYKKSPVDEMHFEPHVGTTPADFARVYAELTKQTKPKPPAGGGKQKPNPNVLGTRRLRMIKGQPMMKGYDVGFVQRWLDVPDDGVYGPKTIAAVIKFKTRRKILNPHGGVDGVWDARCWKAVGY